MYSNLWLQVYRAGCRNRICIHAYTSTRSDFFAHVSEGKHRFAIILPRNSNAFWMRFPTSRKVIISRDRLRFCDVGIAVQKHKQNKAQIDHFWTTGPKKHAFDQGIQRVSLHHFWHRVFGVGLHEYSLFAMSENASAPVAQHKVWWSIFGCFCQKVIQNIRKTKLFSMEFPKLAKWTYTKS